MRLGYRIEESGGGDGNKGHWPAYHEHGDNANDRYH